MERPQENSKRETTIYNWKSVVNFVKNYAENCRYSFNRMLSI